eukprot:gene12501-26313_t
MTLHGGDIKVFSAGEGKGSTFSILLPIHKESNSVQSSHQSTRSRRSSMEEGLVRMFRSRSASGYASSGVGSLCKVIPIKAAALDDYVYDDGMSFEQRILSRISEAKSILHATDCAQLLEDPSEAKYILENSDSVSKYEKHIDILEEKPSSERRKSSLLIVDDSCSNRRMMERLMTDRCGKSRTASDGLEAVNIVKVALLKGEPIVAAYREACSRGSVDSSVA